MKDLPFTPLGTIKQMLIDINLDETPDRLLPVSAGIRTLEIKDVTQEENSEGENIITAELQVNEPESEEDSRKAWDRFNFKYAPARVKFKQLCKAAGHAGTGKGIDPSELIGCTVRAAFKDRVYKDKDTGEMIPTTQISKYIFDAEE